jgi:hypothetical protein
MPASSQATGAAALMTVVLPNSTTTFKAAQAACSGALGSVTFALNHARAHAAAGVDLHEQPSTAAGIITMVFSDSANGESATVEVNSHHRSVAGKNVTAKANKTVACVGAE